jgi:hypothetical protein
MAGTPRLAQHAAYRLQRPRARLAQQGYHDPGQQHHTPESGRPRLVPAQRLRLPPQSLGTHQACADLRRHGHRGPTLLHPVEERVAFPGPPADAAPAPTDYTFTADDAGVHTFTGGATLVTPGDQTITATDTSSGIMRTVRITVVRRGKPLAIGPPCPFHLRERARRTYGRT